VVVCLIAAAIVLYYSDDVHVLHVARVVLVLVVWAILLGVAAKAGSWGVCEWFFSPPVDSIDIQHLRLLFER
jgi:membrane protein YdbS with pleckstrin-like domain